MNQKKPHLVVFTGAGMSAESGLKTFRDHGGLWENHNINEVATPQAWLQNPELVLQFYNMRRKQLFKANPNSAHRDIAQLEDLFQVTVITQNIDDLHERAGSTSVVHLHGELKKVQSERYPELVYLWEKEEIELGDLCEKGYQLRPHVVWFGEAVPMISKAIEVIHKADLFLVIGTSLAVYPAAGLVEEVPQNANRILIDPNASGLRLSDQWEVVNCSATEGMKLVAEEFRKLKKYT